MKTPGEVPARDKVSLREEVRAALAQLSEPDRRECSRQIRSRIKTLEVWKQAVSVLFYAPFGAEPDIWELIKDALASEKRAFLPRFDRRQAIYKVCEIRDAETDTEKGRFGIREPRQTCPELSLNRLDLILVPGIAFDLEGHRLGRGKGYYDRLLAELHGVKCGVAFDEQIVNCVPVEPHDMRLNCIVTPTRWQSVTGPRAVLK